LCLWAPLTCAYATLRQSVANLTFHNVSFNFATTISKFDTFSLSYHIVRKRIAKVTDFLSFCPFGISIFPFCTIGISMYQKRILPYFIIPYFLTPSFFPFGALRTDRRTDFNTPCYLSSFFFPLSARGPTRRRNSTGLAELWGGWRIELAIVR
jgi:hypothetical protein